MTLQKYLLLVGLLSACPVASENSVTKNQIRIYLPFSYPVDPTKIVTIPDMNISYALGSTLIEWGPGKQLSSALASKWEVTGAKVYRFNLRPNVKWSDGAALTSHEIKAALEASLKRHPNDLRSLATLIEDIRCPADQIIDFHLKVETSKSNLLGKLTEPQYAIFRELKSKEIDLRRTTGPFILSSSTKKEIQLVKNPYWIHSNSNTANQVIIRQPPADSDISSILLKDSWPNIAETSSMIPARTLEEYSQRGYSVWKRPLDKMLYLQLGKRIENDNGTKLFQSLREKLNRKIISNEIAGITPAEQAFPKGFQLYDPNFSCEQKNPVLPELFKGKPIRVVISPARITPALRQNFSNAVAEVLGSSPEFVEIPLNELRAKRKQGDYDVYFGTMGLADPDPEGAMSFYFEGDAPVIPSLGKPYVSMLDESRKNTDQSLRLKGFRSLLTRALCEGHFLPLFHLSTVGIAKEELDLSQLSETDESITFSKLRFKDNSK